MKVAIVLLATLVGTFAYRTPNIDPFANWRIVGGQDAAEGQFPYMASVRVGGRHNCGASIIHKQWLLTAAHCVKGHKPKTLTVVVGSNKLSSGGATYQVQKTDYHYRYVSSQKGYDIGVIKVATPIEFSDFVKPIDLLTEFIEEENVTLSGWGRTSDVGSVPDNLQFINLKSITVQDCQQKDGYTNEKEICTLTKEGEGTCYGDSGGPLTYNGKLCGVVSRGYPCARGLPDFFTRVSAYVEWILSEIDSN